MRWLIFASVVLVACRPSPTSLPGAQIRDDAGASSHADADMQLSDGAVALTAESMAIAVVPAGRSPQVEADGSAMGKNGGMAASTVGTSPLVSPSVASIPRPSRRTPLPPLSSCSVMGGSITCPRGKMANCVSYNRNPGMCWNVLRTRYCNPDSVRPASCTCK
jgi:hypothetical protein